MAWTHPAAQFVCFQIESSDVHRYFVNPSVIWRLICIGDSSNPTQCCPYLRFPGRNKVATPLSRGRAELSPMQPLSRLIGLAFGSLQAGGWRLWWNRAAFPCYRYPARLVEKSSSQCSSTSFTDRLYGFDAGVQRLLGWLPHRGVIWPALISGMARQSQ